MASPNNVILEFPNEKNLIKPNAKPKLNENLMNKTLHRRKGFPLGIFRKNNRNTVESKYWGETPFFENAKAASMLEKGWKMSEGIIKPGENGLYIEDDGPTFEAKLDSVNGNTYIFKTKAGKLIKASQSNRFEDWNFYYPTKPVAFVPRKRGGSKKTRRMRRKV